MANVEYHPSNVRVWCVITPEDGEPLTVPVVSVQLRFILNTLPTANVMLAVGRDATNPTASANTHKIGMNLKRGTKFEVWCNLTGVAGPLQGKIVSWPGTDFRVFDGQIMVANPEIGNGLRVSVGAVHWLAKLDSTCWLSSMLDPSGSFAVYHPSTFQRSTHAARASRKSTWWLDLTGTGNIHNYNDDLWIKGLKPSLLEVANASTKVNTPLMRDPTFLQKLYGADKPNSVAIAALERMDNAAHMPIPKIPLFGSMNNDPLVTGTDVQPGPKDLMTSEYVSSLARTLWSAEGSYTLWSKLLRFLKFSILAVSPGVETATVIPWMPVLNTPWLELDSTEIWSVTLNSRMPRAHRGLALILRGFAPWNMRPSAVDGRMGVIGFYDVAQSDSGVPQSLIGKNPGTLTFQFAPSWLDPKGYGYRSATTWRKTIPWVGDKGEAIPAEAPEGVGTLGTAVAKSMFMTEAFKMRGGAVSTRLRFDISPGSMIKFKANNSDYDVPGFTGDGVYANVTGVHITISANPAKCGTTLQISHARLSYESEMSVASHPVYGTKWPGGPLINIPGVTPSW